jgi:purine-cytosine permease-like protein
MCIGRYSFGSVGIFLPIILNCLACIGWSTINTIVGAQALQAVSPAGKHEIPTAAGIVLIAVLTLIVALFGYRIVHMFERYASIPVVVIMLIYLIQIAPHVSSGFADSVGAAEAASVLSFGGTIAGFSFGWTSLAADYTVNFPADSSATKIFAYTYAGLNLPLIVMECIGALAMGSKHHSPRLAVQFSC